MRKFKGGAVSLIKPSKGAIKPELFNLINRFDHLFISSSFYMLVYRWLRPVHRDPRKRRLKAYYTIQNNSSYADGKS